MTKSNR